MYTPVKTEHAGTAGAGLSAGRVSGMNELKRLPITEEASPQVRLRLQIERYRQSPGYKVVFLTHNLGGGTEHHLHELAELLKAEMDVIVIRPAGNGATKVSFGIDPYLSPCLDITLPHDYPALLDLLAYIGISRVHWHHTMGLDSVLYGLSRDLGTPMDCTLHDYFLINSNPVQTNSRGEFTPNLREQAPQYVLPDGHSLPRWQQEQERFLSGAERIFVPSRFAIDYFSLHYPELKYTLAYHPDWEADQPYPSPHSWPLEKGHKLRILVLGAISLEKGAHMLKETARESRGRKLDLEFHLIGYACQQLGKPVKQHGAYTTDQLPALIMSVQPHLIWYPAMWPETYSYTLSEGLKAALPIVAPDIGAFPERLEDRPLTWIQNWKQAPADWCSFFSGLRDNWNDLHQDFGNSNQYGRKNTEQHFSYASDYLKNTVRVSPSGEGSLDLAWLERLASTGDTPSSANSLANRKERFLRLLLHCLQHPVGARVASFIPVWIQRRIKRLLSRRPLKDIL